MRNTFITALVEYAKLDPTIVLITGDLGFSVLEDFQTTFPDRFINAGIAEQNMIGLAAGMALTGKKPFTYSIANFGSLRCLEQIRNDICYHNANVKVISVGSGFAYGTQGYTHHGIEDISIMRALPNMEVYCPADAVEATWLLDHMLQSDHPAYIKLTKRGEPRLHTDLSQHRFPKIIPLIEEGYDKTILSTGVITSHILQWLKETGLEFNLYSVPVIKPLDMEGITQICRNSQTLVTVEEHQLNGGFGSAVLEGVNKLYNQNIIKKMPQIHRYGVEGDIVTDMTTEVFAKKIISEITALHFPENIEA